MTWGIQTHGLSYFHLIILNNWNLVRHAGFSDWVFIANCCLLSHIFSKGLSDYQLKLLGSWDSILSIKILALFLNPDWMSRFTFSWLFFFDPLVSLIAWPPHGFPFKPEEVSSWWPTTPALWITCLLNSACWDTGHT